MSFISLKFCVFILAVIVALYLDKRHQYSKYILLIASYFFYAVGDIRFLGLLILVSFFSWYIGYKIERTKSKGYLAFGVGIDLVILGIFKYYNFFMESFASVLGVQYNSLKIVMPLGVSFYIFQAISYIADVYKRRIVSRSVVDTLLYIGFFPQITSGPIVKAHDFFGQLDANNKISVDRISWGVQKFAVGVFKKKVIADRLGVCVDAVYLAPNEYSGLSVFVAVISYSLQIYYDFAGYSDMAIGIGYMLGYDLGANFNLPYLAKNPSEFWRRWHISLSSWFREYVYIPLGGSRNGKVRTYFNLMLTMLLSGLWHGASWSFVIWGFLHGTISVIHKLVSRIFINIKCDNIFVSTIKVLVNYVIVAILWIPFRTGSINETVIILRRIFKWSRGIEYVYSFSIIFIVMLIIIEIIAAVKTDSNDIWKPLALNKFWSKVVFSLFILFIAVFAYAGNGAFIYAQF